MALKDLMPWGRRGRDARSAALDNVRGLVSSVERALEEPWTLTSARLLGAEWTPRLEVKETSKDIVVTVDVPGVEKDDLHISATEDTLSVRGVKKTSAEAAAEDEDVQQPAPEETEDLTQTFYRSLGLPATVRPDDAKAHFKDGVLTITLPKAKHSKVKRVPIQ